MRNLLSLFYRDRSGASAVQYVLAAAMIALAIIVGMQFLAGQLNNEFNTIGNSVAGADSSPRSDFR